MDEWEKIPRSHLSEHGFSSNSCLNACQIKCILRYSHERICLLPPRPPALENSDSDIGLCGWLLVSLSILLMLVTLPVSVWMCIKVSERFVPQTHIQYYVSLFNSLLLALVKVSSVSRVIVEFSNYMLNVK